MYDMHQCHELKRARPQQPYDSFVTQAVSPVRSRVWKRSEWQQ